LPVFDPDEDQNVPAPTEAPEVLDTPLTYPVREASAFGQGAQGRIEARNIRADDHEVGQPTVIDAGGVPARIWFFSPRAKSFMFVTQVIRR